MVFSRAHDLPLGLLCLVLSGCSSSSTPADSPTEDARADGTHATDGHAEAAHLPDAPAHEVGARDAAPQGADAARHDAGDAATEDAMVASGLGLLGNGTPVHGAKLQCTADPTNSMICNQSPFGYETHGLSYADAVAAFAGKGVEDVVVKVCETNNQCSFFTPAERNANLLPLLAAFHDAKDPTSAHYIPGYTPHVFLWERQWMWAADGGLNDNDLKFAGDMSSIINAADADAGTGPVGDVIAGVGAIEDQLPGSADVLSVALAVATSINAQTHGWLQTHALMFPGAGDGNWFDGIASKSTSQTFFASMSEQAGQFTFVYKNMPLQKNCSGTADDNPLCSRGVLVGTVSASAPDGGRPYSHDFVDCLENSVALSPDAGYLGTFDCTTDVGKKAYLLAPNSKGGLGLADLRTLIANDCHVHPALTNVMFWGDSADAFTEMSAGNVRVLHEVLVDDPWTPADGGCPTPYVVPQFMKANQFSHLEILPTLLQGDDQHQYIYVLADAGLADDPTASTPKNGTSYTNPLTVFQEWNLWPRQTPATCGDAQPCY